MTKTRTTLTIDESLLKMIKVRAARLGLKESEVIEDAVRRSLGLDLLERLWERHTFSDEEANDIALEAQHATRKSRHPK